MIILMVPLTSHPKKLLRGTPNQNPHPTYDRNPILTAIGSKTISTRSKPNAPTTHIFHPRQK